MFTIVITEHADDDSSPIQRYSQTVDTLDLNAVIAAVNEARVITSEASENKMLRELLEILVGTPK